MSMLKLIFSFLIRPWKVSLQLKEKDSKYKNSMFFLVLVMYVAIYVVLLLLATLLSFRLLAALLQSMGWLSKFSILNQSIFNILITWLVLVIVWAIIYSIVAIIILLIFKIFKWEAKFGDILVILTMSCIPQMILLITSVIFMWVNFSWYVWFAYSHPILMNIYSLFFIFWSLIIFSIWITKVEWFKKNILLYIALTILIAYSIYSLRPLINASIEKNRKEKENEIIKNTPFSYEILEEKNEDCEYKELESTVSYKYYSKTWEHYFYIKTLESWNKTLVKDWITWDEYKGINDFQIISDNWDYIFLWEKQPLEWEYFWEKVIVKNWIELTEYSNVSSFVIDENWENLLVASYKEDSFLNYELFKNWELIYEFSSIIKGIAISKNWKNYAYYDNQKIYFNWEKIWDYSDYPKDEIFWNYIWTFKFSENWEKLIFKVWKDFMYYEDWNILKWEYKEEVGDLWSQYKTEVIEENWKNYFLINWEKILESEMSIWNSSIAPNNSWYFVTIYKKNYDSLTIQKICKNILPLEILPNNEKSNKSIVNIEQKSYLKKELIKSKVLLQKLENWNDYINTIDEDVKNLSDNDIIMYYNNEKNFNFDYLTIKEALDYFNIMTKNEIHLRDNIEKNIIE